MTEAIVLEAGGTSAGIDPVGGGIAWCRVGGVDVVEPRDAGGAGRFCTGAVLFPWPNRVRAARWVQDGTVRTLDVTEPERGHANHGLVLDAPFRVDAATAGTVRLTAVVGPAPGYPFTLRLAVRYSADDGGLAVRYEIANAGEAVAPVAIGAHPYLRVGAVPTERLTVELPVTGMFTLDEALIPAGVGPLTGEHAALPTGLRLGRRTLNACYVRAAGRSPARVVAPDGAAVELEADDDFAYLQVFACDDFPGPGGVARAVAIEPMTTPPDALNSGRGLRWLAPGENWAPGWRLRYRAA